MKGFKKLSLLTLALVVSCGDKSVKMTDAAIQAMERARVAEADIYAPQEYKIANELFTQMKDAMDKKDKTKASELAQSVIDAANKAIDVARQNKATTLVSQLKKALKVAQQLGIDVQNPNEYAQATQGLIDAENFYSQPDYEKTIEVAQNSLDTLNTVIGGAEALALANLNRARELLDRAYKSTDTTKTQKDLTNASIMIEQSAQEYQSKHYLESIGTSQSAIDLLNELIAKYPGDGSISIRVSDDENLQLKAYDLIKQLGNTITFIKENNYTKPVSTSTPISIEVSTKQMQTNSDPVITNSNDELLEEDTEEDIGIFLYEDDEDTNTLSYLPLSFKAESKDTANKEMNLITLEVIEQYQHNAQQYYNEGNYLNAIDTAREGLRLSELYLAGQVLKIHTVIKGDTLWDISKGVYNEPWLWPNIWRANKLQIKDPDLIYPNQEFNIPPAPITK